MPRLISRVTGAVLAATGACLGTAAVSAGLLLSSSSPSAAASRPAPSGGGSVHSEAPERAASATTISARHTSAGTILLGPRDETLFAFTRDRRNHSACSSVRGCLSVWPLVTVHGHLTAGRRVRRSLLGTIIVHGKHQLTYAGHPLYSFAEDNRPADTSYVGVSEFGGRWPALSPAGRFVH